MVYRRLCFALFYAWSAGGLFAQVSFTRRPELLPPAPYYSSAAIAVLDMNGDGRDDIVRMDQGFRLAIEYQSGPNLPFNHRFVAELQQGSQWGICAADIDNNGFPDVLTGGQYDGIKVAMASADGASFTVITHDDPQTFTQGVNLADIDNDGWLDAFACHDDGPGRIFINDGTGQLDYAPQTIDLSTEPPSDDSGNYGSVWSDVDNDGDIDLYIAKCRQNVNDPADGRRINQLFLNNADGTYTQDIANASGLRIGAQSWTGDFGDIDNDGDFDCFVTNHDRSSQLLENDGAGHFSDISTSAGLNNAITGLPIQGIFRDFDNDGFVDLLVAGSDHYLFHNNGDKTFSELPILDVNPMESYAVGDLNSDGFQDIYAGYAEIFSDPGTIPDALWLNDGNGNNYFGMNLRGVQSNRSGIGAKVVLYSALGTQVREARSGESYGIMNSMQIHFGLGQLTQIDSVLVRWPSGIVDTLYHPAPNQYLTLEEGGCVVPKVEIAALGSTTFCSGDSVSLQAPANYTYAWSTGSAGQTVSVSTAGQYAVTVTNAGGCTAVSNMVQVVVDPVQIPVITALGDTTFCAGGSVILVASPAVSYLWNTGDTANAVEVEQSGAYFVTAQGLCAAFSSAPVQVTVLEAPAPAPAPDTVALNASASLSAAGAQLYWYDAPAGGNYLFSGNPFVTPLLGHSTTYWVSNLTEYDQPNQFTGMKDHEGSNFANAQTNGGLVFDCFAPFRLARVKVYTNKAGVRKIVLNDAFGQEIQSVPVNIPVGATAIDLNFDVPAGANMLLTTDPAVNAQTLQSNGPQLRRSDLGVVYPYELPGYVRIKSSNFGADRYYYFYDWEIDFYGYACESERVPVTAVVDSSLVPVHIAPFAENNIRLYPNPASGAVRVDMEHFEGGRVSVALRTAQGVALQRLQFHLPAGATGFPLALQGMESGVYWLELQTAGGVWRRRLLVL